MSQSINLFPKSKNILKRENELNPRHPFLAAPEKEELLQRLHSSKASSSVHNGPFARQYDCIACVTSTALFYISFDLREVMLLNVWMNSLDIFCPNRYSYFSFTLISFMTIGH